MKDYLSYIIKGYTEGERTDWYTIIVIIALIAVIVLSTWIILGKWKPLITPKHNKRKEHRQKLEKKKKAKCQQQQQQQHHTIKYVI